MEENAAEGPHSLHCEGGRKALRHWNDCGDSSARPTEINESWRYDPHVHPPSIILSKSRLVHPCKPSGSFSWPFEVLEPVEFRSAKTNLTNTCFLTILNSFSINHGFQVHANVLHAYNILATPAKVLVSHRFLRLLAANWGNRNHGNVRLVGFQVKTQYTSETCIVYLLILSYQSIFNQINDPYCLLVWDLCSVPSTEMPICPTRLTWQSFKDSSIN